MLSEYPMEDFNIGGLTHREKENTLWMVFTHQSWRELAINGSLIIVTAFLGYLAGSTGTGQGLAAVAVRAAIGGSAGFFGVYTPANYPSLKQRNDIKTETLSIYNDITRQLADLGNQYPEHQLIQSYIEHIKRIAKNIYDLHPETNNKNEYLQCLLDIKVSIQQINLKVEKEIDVLNTHTDKNAYIEESIQFWKRPMQDILKDLANPEENHDEMNDEVNDGYRLS